MILKRLNVEVEATEKEEISRLRSEGFEPVFEELEEEDGPESVALNELTVKELRALAVARGLKPSSVLRKQELIELLEETYD